MKQLKIRRVNVIGRPTDVSELATLNTDYFEDDWQIETEKMEVRRLRQWRQQLSSGA